MNSSARFNLALNGTAFYVYDIPESFSARYTQDHFNQNYYGLRDIKLKPKAVVVDLGANLGAISMFLARKFPSARFHAVEPLEVNYLNMKRAVEEQGFTNITCHMLAIDCLPGEVLVGAEGSLSGCAKIITNQAGMVYKNVVEAKTLPQFMDDNKIKKIDLLKINIEGAEFPIFAALSDEWFKKHVGNIVGELHYFQATDLETRIKALYPGANLRLA